MGTERVAAPLIADERTTLTGFLDFQRATLERKCAGLTDAQLRDRPLAPSQLSLLGIVRHLAEVERNWFRTVVEGQEMVTIFWPPLDWQRTWSDLDNASIEGSFAVWRAECAHSRELVAAAPSLEVTGQRRGEQIGLRWVLTHMIEEYARHNGHADLIRERLDGATGESWRGRPPSRTPRPIRQSARAGLSAPPRREPAQRPASGRRPRAASARPR